ncbi:hypothetical protein AOX55_00003333 [Sinorhizobium fredii CCBAU 25509]|nr:hypothetical protein SF83666_c30820 [Sinorhizobium fredii CCBAU 83666]AWM26571.1 hypothetical protein AOX55_00003333 [Sinorhizobium fredii CCBAU 25509]
MFDCRVGRTSRRYSKTRANEGAALQRQALFPRRRSMPAAEKTLLTR